MTLDEMVRDAETLVSRIDRLVTVTETWLDTDVVDGQLQGGWAKTLYHSLRRLAEAKAGLRSFINLVRPLDRQRRAESTGDSTELDR